MEEASDGAEISIPSESERVSLIGPFSKQLSETVSPALTPQKGGNRQAKSAMTSRPMLMERYSPAGNDQAIRLVPQAAGHLADLSPTGSVEQHLLNNTRDYFHSE